MFSLQWLPSRWHTKHPALQSILVELKVYPPPPTFSPLFALILFLIECYYVNFTGILNNHNVDRVIMPA